MIRTRLAAALSAALLLGAVSAGFCQEKKIDFKLKWTAGATYKLTVISEINANTKFKDYERKSTSFSVYGYVMHVDSVESDGNATATLTIADIRNFCDRPDRPCDFGSSSSGKQQNGAEKALSLIKGKSFNLKIDCKGQIQSIKGIDELWNLITAGTSGMSQEDQAGAKEKFDGFIDQLKELLTGYPAHPVAIGERWEKPPVTEKDAPYVIQDYCKITEVKDGRISVKIYSAYLPHVIETVEDGTKYVLSGSGAMEGTASYDEATGMLKSLSTSGTVRCPLKVIADDTTVDGVNTMKLKLSMQVEKLP